MTTYVNTDYQRRAWISVSTPDGTTLELGPGETADLDLPADFADEHLKPVPAVKAAKKTDPPA